MKSLTKMWIFSINPTVNSAKISRAVLPGSRGQAVRPLLAVTDRYGRLGRGGDGQGGVASLDATAAAKEKLSPRKAGSCGP